MGLGVKVLGEKVDGVPRPPRSQYDFSLDRAEVQDLINQVAFISRSELAYEQRRKNLKNAALTFNKGYSPRKHGSEYQAKLGTSFQYTQPNKDIYEVTRAAQNMFEILVSSLITPHTRRYEDGNEWALNGKKIIPNPNMVLNYGDNLVIFNKVPYAKFVEFKETRNWRKGHRIFLLLQHRLRRRFGKEYIINRVVVDNTKKAKKEYATPAHFYFDRWETAMPGIAIFARKNHTTKIGTI